MITGRALFGKGTNLRTLTEIVEAKIEPYQFQVGILKNSSHRFAKDYKKFGLANYLGAPLRKKGKPSKITVAQVSKNIREDVLHFNYLTRPFEKAHRERDVSFKTFMKLCFDESPGRMLKRLRNNLQAVVRTPILKQKYGVNSPATVERKGFNSFLFDTGQFFKSITASVTKTGRGA